MSTIPRILIVDDNADHRLLLAYQLAKIQTFEIHEAEDLIFMNLGLPILDGWETIRQIRMLAAPLGQAPIIAFTAYAAGGQEEQRARQAGCSEYMVKPVLDRAVLQQIVTSLLARRQRHYSRCR